MLQHKLRIGFVVPCDLHNYEPFRNQPLNALHLLTIIKQHYGENVDVSIIDLRGVHTKNITYYISEKDLYLYSVATIEYLETVRTVEEVRKLFPKAKHVAGGIHINIYPNESSKHFDGISLGDGENTICEIVNDAIDNNLKQKYIETKILDVNEVPHPDRGFLPKRSIVNEGLLNGEYYHLPSTAVLFSRGCPFNCSFCANLIQSKAKFRSSALIVKEIEYLKRVYGVKALAIKDDNIMSANVECSTEVLTAIGKTDVKWRGNSRANNISEETVKLAKESGCVDLAIGIESISQKVLNNINKRLNLGKAKVFLGYLKKYGIDIRLNLIIGLPGEPTNIVDKSIEFIEKFGPSSVLLSILTPVPGSDMFENPEKYGMIFDKNTPFNKLFCLFGRFDENEKPDMVFEYKRVTPFGESMSNDQISDNYSYLQEYLRNRKLTF